MDVNEELIFCENTKNRQKFFFFFFWGGGGCSPGGSGWGGVSGWM